MTFEKFQKHGESFAPRVSVWVKGTLGVSAGAFNLFELTDKLFVTLYFDAKHNRVGMEFSSKPEPDAIRMTVRKSGGIVPCKSFFQKYNIDYSVVRTYVLTWSEQEGKFIFDLDLPIEDDDCPEAPHALFVEDVYAGLEMFLNARAKHDLSVKTRAKLARTLFSIAAHHHMDAGDLQHLLAKAMDPKLAKKDKRALRLNKILTAP